MELLIQITYVLMAVGLIAAIAAYINRDTEAKELRENLDMYVALLGQAHADRNHRYHGRYRELQKINSELTKENIKLKRELEVKNG